MRNSAPPPLLLLLLWSLVSADRAAEDDAPELTPLPPAPLFHGQPGWHRVFAACDADRDQGLCRTELVACMSTGMRTLVRQQRLTALLDQHDWLVREMKLVDANRDGTASLEELAASMGSHTGCDRVKALWNVSDTNQDGKLALDELLLRYHPSLAATTEHSEQAVHKFAVHDLLQMDTNADGFVSWDEYDTRKSASAEPRDDSTVEADRASFLTADGDGDRELSKGELGVLGRARHTPDWHAEASELLELIDANRDGVLTIPELEERYSASNAHLTEILQQHTVRSEL